MACLHDCVVTISLVGLLALTFSPYACLLAKALLLLPASLSSTTASTRTSLLRCTLAWAPPQLFCAVDEPCVMLLCLKMSGAHLMCAGFVAFVGVIRDVLDQENSLASIVSILFKC